MNPRGCNKCTFTFRRNIMNVMKFVGESLLGKICYGSYGSFRKFISNVFQPLEFQLYLIPLRLKEAAIRLMKEECTCLLLSTFLFLGNMRTAYINRDWNEEVNNFKMC